MGVRWECPNGKHPAVNGPEKPRRENVVRFCLPCSADAGVLVSRTAPALERKRAEKAAASAARRKREEERRRAAAVARERVTVRDYEEGTVDLDVRDLFWKAWWSETLVDVRSTWSVDPRRVPLPPLNVRRGKVTRLNSVSLERARDGMSGHAYYQGGRVALTIAPHCGREWVEAIVIHEAAHSAGRFSEHHGPAWRTAYLRTVRELYGIEGVVLGSQANWRLDEEISAAIRAKGSQR